MVMKITFVLPIANMAGGTRIIVTLADLLSRRGHDVTVVSAPPKQLPFKRRVKGLLTGKHSFFSSKKQPSYLDEMNLNHHVIDSYRPLRDTDVPDADVIVASWWETAEWVANLSAQKGAKAYFIQQYEVNFGQPKPRVDATWHLPMQKIVCSKWLRDKAADEYNDDQAIIVNNGIDLELFNAPARSKQNVPTIGFMYSNSVAKRAWHCFEVIRRVREVHPNLRVICFGAMPPADDHKMPDCCEFHLLPKQQEIRDLYAQCDLWLCASQSEGFHLPPHEAMACHCPVVSTRVGGPMDMIEDGHNGFVVDIDDVDALTDRTLQVLALSHDAWENMSKAAYEKAIEYPWDLATERFENALQLACDRCDENGEVRYHSQLEKLVGA